jgi:hypothetical protein
VKANGGAASGFWSSDRFLGAMEFVMRVNPLMHSGNYMYHLVVIWDVTPCNPLEQIDISEVHVAFRLQGRRLSQAKNQLETTSKYFTPTVLHVASGLVVRVPSYRSRGRGSILGATKFSEK